MKFLHPEVSYLRASQRWNENVTRSKFPSRIIHIDRKTLCIDARDFYSLKIRTVQIGHFDNSKRCMDVNISCSNLHLMNTWHINSMIVRSCFLLYSLFWSDVRFITWSPTTREHVWGLAKGRKTTRNRRHTQKDMDWVQKNEKMTYRFLSISIGNIVLRAYLAED